MMSIYLEIFFDILWTIQSVMSVMGNIGEKKNIITGSALTLIRQILRGRNLKITGLQYTLITMSSI